MIGPKTRQLIALAEELSNKTDGLGKKPNINTQFEAQRQFGRMFFKKLRNVYGELMGDLLTLKERQFDPNMYRLADKVKGEVIRILNSIKENNPHAGGWELVDYALEKPNSAIIDNLDFLAKHHVKTTQPQTNFEVKAPVKHAEVNSFQHLKELAQEIKNYMEQHPPVSVPTSSPPPPLGSNPMADPSIKAPPDAVTKI